MLDNLDIDQLADLADKNGVKVDKRWAKQRIVKTLADKNVKAPEAGDKLSAKVDQEPVRFLAGIGSIRVKDSYFAPDGGAGRVLVPGLVVQFCDAKGEPIGGYSRDFYPDKPDCDNAEDCDCAGCLAAVRDYIKHNKHGKVIAANSKIQEVSKNEPTLPFSGWDRISGQDVNDLHGKLGFDIAEAMRFEKAKYGRQDVIDALDTLASKDEDDVEDADILAAEVEA